MGDKYYYKIIIIIMIDNSHSYRYIYIDGTNQSGSKGTFRTGIKLQYIDMIYILTLENSNRLSNNRLYELHNFNITIQVNKGYKNCKKNLYKQTSIYDINDAFYHCFLHANNMNYKNIMILEDDFQFDNINILNILNEIGSFINNNKYDIYHLGPVMHFSVPFTFKHHRCLFMQSAHSCIYSINYINYYIEKYNNKLTQRNDMLWNDINIIKYKYYRPVCYQLFPETENQKDWTNIFITLFIKFFKLDKYYFPGYIIFNIVSYLILLLIIILRFLILVLKNQL